MSARKRLALFICCLMACSAIFAGDAFAESDGGGSFGDEIVFGPSIYNVAQNQYYVIVNAPNTYNAALTALGYDPYSSKFTDSVKAYLSDRSTGGSFWEFAQLFTSEEPLNDSVSLNHVYFASAFHTAIDLYGQGRVFGAIYSQDLADGAKERVEAVLSGDVGGSGGGETDNRRYIDFTYHPSQYFAGVSKVRFDITNMSIYGSDFSVIKSGEISINSVDTNKSQVGFGLALFTSSTFSVVDDGGRKKAQIESGDYTTMVGTYSYSITDDVLTIHRSNASLALNLSTPSSYPFSIWMKDDYGIFNGIIADGGDWPDDPPVVAPSPPELPTPHDPVIPNPPVDPTPPDPPTYITQPVYVTNTFTVDLQGILDALDEHCQHLQNALYSDLKSLNDNVIAKLGAEGSTTRSLISERFNWLGMVLGECFETLDDDIYDYFHWLAAQFDFQSGGGYNDNTVVAWLKRIYARLGKGPFNTRPVDPVADPFGFDDWLNELWKQFIMFLQNLLGGALSPIAVAIGALADNFPFCLPWDMMAMLGLLVAAPVAPNFDIPIYYLTDSGVQSSMQHVDLSPWTPYLGPLQLLFTILFVKQLIHLTPKVMQFFNVAGGE